MANLEIYVLNVGQADTAIIKTPQDNIIVIDAVKPKKIKNVLGEISPNREISHLIVTHPHQDHYSAVSSLLVDFCVQRVILSPFWYEPGTPLYHQIINRAHQQQIPIRFLSGYERIYPDGGTFPTYQGPYVELLGPPNDILDNLHESEALNPNHLSIIARLTYGEFSMVFAADAQMENWAHYDREGMLEKKCDVLKAAHHGSRRGNQWERLERLSPKLVIVSSDPDKRHKLPDLIGSVIFWEYDRGQYGRTALTRETGTIRIVVQDPEAGRYEAFSYREKAVDDVFPGAQAPLPQTDWLTIVRNKLDEGE
jgi:competence protein ComEC